MNLVRVQEFIDDHFKGRRRPHPDTIRNWIRLYLEGHPRGLAGDILGNDYWVDVDAYNMKNSPIAKGNPQALENVNRILSGR